MAGIPRNASQKYIHRKKKDSKLKNKTKQNKPKKNIKTYLVKNKIQILHKPVKKSKNIHTSTIQELDFRK